jgi:dienelactone hydrolase
VRAPFLLLALAAALAGCAGDDGATSTTTTPTADPYAYDASAPLRFRDVGRINRNSRLQVRDVVFAGADDQPVRAYLVRPPGEGPYPAVIYLHGAGGDRVELLGIAAWLAARGAVALTVDAPPPPEQEQNGGIEALRRERNHEIRAVVDVRRAVDLLQSLPQVDDDRIGLVGFSAGARSAAILAGVEHRIGALVLWSGGAEPVEAYAEGVGPDLRAEVVDVLTDVDPLRWVAQSESELLFQNGEADEVVPKEALERLYEAAPEPKEIRWYPAGHVLDTPAFRDQLDWLTEKLEITGPRVQGAATEPPPGS